MERLDEAMEEVYRWISAMYLGRELGCKNTWKTGPQNDREGMKS